MPMVSLQLSEEILNRLDSTQRNSGYLSRSEALRDAILLFISSKESKKESGIRRAIVSVVYSVELDSLEVISKIDIRFAPEIKTYTEYVIEKTIRAYILVGEVQRLGDFVDEFNKIKDTQVAIIYL